MLSFLKVKQLSNIVEPQTFQRKSHSNHIFKEKFSYIIMELNNLNLYNNQWYEFLECNR